MYEEQKESIITERMLKRVSNDVDKREGSLIYDAIVPTAIEFELLYAVLDYYIKNTFGDTADRDFLIERAKERGLTPKKSSPAVVKVKVDTDYAKDYTLPKNSRFSYDDVNYRITKKLEAVGMYEAVCETSGEKGNKVSGTIIPIEYIPELKKAELVEIVRPGEEEEETELFRKRYLESFETQAFGGNIQDYQRKIKQIAGVGGVKVEPIWQGAGTVKIVFCTSKNEPPTKELVSEVQEYVDPIPYAQQGVGIAPVGHRVTVFGAEWQKINIGLKIVFNGASSFTNKKERITEIIQKYFDEINKNWQKTQTVTTTRYENIGLTVRISQIEARLIAEEFVQDISHTTLNGKEDNIQLDPYNLAMIGTIESR